MNGKLMAVALAIGAFLSSSAQGAFILEIDTDGADDGVVTYNANFAFGGDTTTASQSVASSAYGMTGGDSIFGGNGSAFLDTYVYTYTPGSDVDNLAIPAGTDLGNGVLATGAPGGAPGAYNVYATWPFTNNVSGGLTTYTIDTAGDSLVADIDQNGTGNIWVPIGTINYTAGAIVVTQNPHSNTFVSMRAAGILFEARSAVSAVPEPSTFVLLGSGGLLALFTIRRKHLGRARKPVESRCAQVKQSLPKGGLRSWNVGDAT
jgi:hypothetical protein